MVGADGLGRTTIPPNGGLFPSTDNRQPFSATRLRRQVGAPLAMLYKMRWRIELFFS